MKRKKKGSSISQGKKHSWLQLSNVTKPKANVTENNTFVPEVFTRSKKDGSKRMILNLKRLNKFVDYKHFKMESLQNVLELIRPGVYMASIDLKDAFYSVTVHKNHQAYLKFFAEEYLKFVCLPNGYGPAMQIFTKIFKNIIFYS